MTDRLLIAFPLYRDVSVQWFLRFLHVDKSPVTDIIAVRKLYLASAMSTMVRDALEHDTWDRLVVWEADVLPPIDALVRIAAYPGDKDIDVTGAAIFQHEPPHRLYCYAQVDETHYQAVDRDRVHEMMATPGLYPCDAVGFGFTSIARYVLEKWDPAVPMFGGEMELGHDMYFSREAKRQGWKVRIDTGIHCGHLTEAPVDYGDCESYSQRSNADQYQLPLD